MRICIDYCDSRHHGETKVHAVYRGSLGIGWEADPAGGPKTEVTREFDVCRGHLDQLMNRLQVRPHQDGHNVSAHQSNRTLLDILGISPGGVLK